MVPDDLQQLWPPLGEPPQIALKQIPPRLHITPLMSSLHKRFERGVVDQAVRLGKARQAADGDLAVCATEAAYPERDRLTARVGGVAFVVGVPPHRQLQGENVADLGFRVSETYLSAKHGKFIKIRLTLVEKDFKKRELDINRFVKELAGILGSHKSPAARIELRPLTDTAEEPATRSEDQIIEALIAKLGAPDFRDRRAAERDLLEIGKPAVPFLQAQKEHWDPEIRTRIKEVLATINAEPKNAGMKDFRIYRVGRGEDLYSVALLWNVSVQRLKEFNRLEGTGLAVGQEIKIPLFP